MCITVYTLYIIVPRLKKNTEQILFYNTMKLLKALLWNTFLLQGTIYFITDIYTSACHMYVKIPTLPPAEITTLTVNVCHKLHKK